MDVRARNVLSPLVCLGAAYLLFAYGLIPGAWRRALARRPALVDAPRLSRTGSGIPGDPLNIALVATEAQVVGAMLGAGWHPADPITLKSSLRIVGSTVFHRPYEDAPVSNLLLWGRKQDLAFELEVGHDARERHHVRLWRSDELDSEGRVTWFGAATYDMKVGFSHTTGQVTHHISPNIDAERDRILADLRAADEVEEAEYLDDFHKVREGKNGNGDPYRTDARLCVVVLRSNATLRPD